MDYKKQPKGRDYVVPPLEGLWYLDNMEEWSMEEKDKWHWTMMIRIPDFIPDKEIKNAIDVVKDKKREKAPFIDKLRYETYNEGKVVQLMHIGSYDSETSNIAKMHKYAYDNNFILDGFHHEIYLSDPRRTKVERLKTVIRQPITKK